MSSEMVKGPLGEKRIPCALPVHVMKTYQVSQPKQSHFRPATCQEARCVNMQYGWKTVIDESTELGQAQAHYIRFESGRKFIREPVTSDGPVTYTFEAGQKCFAQHQVSLEREPLFVVRGGDWRGNPRGEVRKHVNADDWVDDFANHQLMLENRLSQG